MGPRRIERIGSIVEYASSLFQFRKSPVCRIKKEVRRSSKLLNGLGVCDQMLDECGIDPQ